MQQLTTCAWRPLLAVHCPLCASTSVSLLSLLTGDEGGGVDTSAAAAAGASAATAADVTTPLPSSPVYRDARDIGA